MVLYRQSIYSRLHKLPEFSNFFAIVGVSFLFVDRYYWLRHLANSFEALNCSRCNYLPYFYTGVVVCQFAVCRNFTATSTEIRTQRKVRTSRNCDKQLSYRYGFPNTYTSEVIYEVMLKACHSVSSDHCY